MATLYRSAIEVMYLLKKYGKWLQSIYLATFKLIHWIDYLSFCIIIIIINFL